VLAVDDRYVAFCEYNGSVARIICVTVATLANEKLLERASDNDLLLCRKSTSNKTRYRQWFDRCIISKMILKSESNWLFPVKTISVEITLSGSHSGNSFEFSHRPTGFLNYALFCLSFCLSLNLKPVNYFTTRSNFPYRVVGPCRLTISVNVPKVVTKRSPFLSCRYSKACLWQSLNTMFLS
jgi:hypothetical protein